MDRAAAHVQLTLINLTTGEYAHGKPGETWTHYSPFSHTVDRCIAVYLAVICGVSVIANLTVITLTLRKGCAALVEMDFINVTLAFCQIIPSVSSYPLVIISAFYHHWSFSAIDCQRDAFSVFFFAMATIGILVTTVIYRYLRMFHPHLFPRSRKASKCSLFHACLGIPFIFALAWAFPPLVGIGRYTLEPYNLACSLEWKTLPFLYTANLFLFGYAVPIVLMAYCYSKIIRWVRSSTRSLKGRRNALNTHENSVQKMRRDHQNVSHKGWMRKDSQATLLVVIHCGFFLFIWTPYAVISFFSTVGYSFPDWSYVFCSLAAKMDTLINPFVYFFIMRTAGRSRKKVKNNAKKRTNSEVPKTAWYLAKNTQSPNISHGRESNLVPNTTVL